MSLTHTMAAGLCERERTESPLLLTQKGVATRAQRRGSGLAVGDGEFGDVAHDLRQLEILRGVDRSDTHRRESGSVVLGDDATHDHRCIDAHLLEVGEHVGHQIEV